MDPEQFAAIIAGLESQGYSQPEIARNTGLSRATVWRIATGSATRPSYETITRLKDFSENVRSVSDMKHG